MIIPSLGIFSSIIAVFVLGWIVLSLYKKRIKKTCQDIASKGLLFVSDPIYFYSWDEIWLKLCFKGGFVCYIVGIDHPDFDLISSLKKFDKVELQSLECPIEALEEFRSSSYLRFKKACLSEDRSAPARA